MRRGAIRVAGFRMQARNIPAKKAKQVANALYDIETSVGLTADSVLDTARDRKSILHELFDWDDSIAAEKWRRNQASDLIRSVHFIYEEDDGNKRETRAFVSVEREERSYVNVGTVMSDPDLRSQMLQRALAEAKQWRKRFEDLNELAQIFTAIDSTEAKVTKRR